MSGRFLVSVRQLDFGREYEIIVADSRHPTRRMSMRVVEQDIPDLEEMLQAIIDKIGASKSEPTSTPVERLKAAFEEGVSNARQEDRTA